MSGDELESGPDDVVGSNRLFHVLLDRDQTELKQLLLFHFGQSGELVKNAIQTEQTAAVRRKAVRREEMRKVLRRETEL